MKNTNRFLFLGNGSYNNHGCEAIVRGTMNILAKAYQKPVVAGNGISERGNVVDLQERNIPIKGVHSFSILKNPSLIERISSKIQKLHSVELITSSETIAPFLGQAEAMLALGGDNFSLEYGIPYYYLGWNALARDAGLPVYIWGSSVGPFSSNPKFEQQFVKHAKTLQKIFVRETETLNYLTKLGLSEKLYLAADPAFAMQPNCPKNEFIIPEGALGLNLSPLMAEFVTNGALDVWKEKAIEIILGIANATNRPIVLIPHVNATSATKACDPGWPLKDDFGFLQSITLDSRLAGVDLTLVSDQFSAPELKFVISKLWAFAGARTHATIAAFSSQVPCISFAYSVKARGLNKDILGTTDYCIPPAELSAKRVIQVLSKLENSYDALKDRYSSVVPGMIQSAFSAGEILKESIDDFYS